MIPTCLLVISVSSRVSSLTAKVATLSMQCKLRKHRANELHLNALGARMTRLGLRNWWEKHSLHLFYGIDISTDANHVNG